MAWGLHPLNAQSLLNKATRPQGNKGTWPQGYKATRPTRPQGNKATRQWGNKATRQTCYRPQGNEVTGPRSCTFSRDCLGIRSNTLKRAQSQNSAWSHHYRRLTEIASLWDSYNVLKCSQMLSECSQNSARQTPMFVDVTSLLGYQDTQRLGY